ncbi:hypothetical protein CEXT_527691 [Caerostris extrusa]|uniref:Uncharacterized protein n=1 Tax=Caerostris extrusa TaxID=172846 RepID=A0AAV4NJE5_CAEEX|nr:hypothetical protein CEXT_527691 [Caerostris extrusa]
MKYLPTSNLLLRTKKEGILLHSGLILELTPAEAASKAMDHRLWGSTIRDAYSSSPTSSSKRPSIRRRKLPFNENVTKTPSDSDKPKAERIRETSTVKESTSLTPRSYTPLSERQQIAFASTN